jgi:tetratricopeptide (TPR) repeat protein
VGSLAVLVSSLALVGATATALGSGDKTAEDGLAEKASPDAPSDMPEWVLLAEKVQALMHEGLELELFGRYEQAEKLYLQAAKADPQDAIPLRFLGEIYRHHIGRWDLAKARFEAILDLTKDGSDPFSRAIALHGLGKMTIFGGDFTKGEELMQESLRACPTQLSLRNLAVFWNSEGEFERARGFARRALKIAPHDPYTRVFWATYLAQDGKRDETLTILDDVAIDASMFYNVACIYSELDSPRLAMEFLRRHFEEFESNENVRWYEKQEARSDYSLRKLHDLPAFRTLTEISGEPPTGAPEIGPPAWKDSEAAKRMKARTNGGQ